MLDDDTIDSRLAAVEAHPKLGRPQKAALRLVAEGRSYREAAREAGLKSTADLRRHAERFGLRDTHLVVREVQKIEDSKTLVRELREVAGRGAQELVRRLVEDAQGIQTRDLTVLTGVAVDKLAKWESWGEQERDANPSGLGALLERLGASGGTVSVSIQPNEPAIDVTPTSSEPQPR